MTECSAQSYQKIVHHSLLWGLLLGLLTACNSSSEPTITTFYYLLDEKTHQVIEFNAQTQKIERTFSLNLPDFDKSGPEGLVFVSNEDVESWGLLGLDTMAEGGYFLVSVQKHGLIYLFDLPLPETNPPASDPLMVIEIPELTRDAAAMDYQAGQLWIIAPKDDMVHQVDITQTVIRSIATYDLSSLPFKDIEGLAMVEQTAYLADDAAQTVSRIDSFPACLSTYDCTLEWQLDFSPAEPSGLAWDKQAMKLVTVDDQGAMMLTPPEGGYFQTLLNMNKDFEGVTVVYRKTLPKHDIFSKTQVVYQSN